MEAGKRTVFDYFNGKKSLDIPFFQRAYVWGEEQWERLLDDLEGVCLTRSQYFMGPIILKQQPTSSNSNVGDVRLVVDGQQRLTTLSILLKVLCLKNNDPEKYYKSFRLDNKSPVIRHNHNDVAAYNRIVELETLEPIDSQDNISLAYQYFVRNLDPNKVDFDSIGYLVMFVGIDLASDEDEQQIFDTINSLGVNLTTAELLKNYFFSRHDIDEYNKLWVKVFENDEETREFWDMEITAGRQKRTFIDVFFHSFLQIKIQDSSYRVTTDDKKEFSNVGKLFNSFKRFIAKYCDDNKRAILDEIRDYAITFKATFNVDAVDHELPATNGIERINAIIFSLDTATLIPYILFIERNQEDQYKKDELYSIIESYIMRRLVTRSTTKNYNQLFTDRLILNRVLTKNRFIEYIGGQEDKINRMPDDDEVRSAFHESMLTNKYALGVLYFIESMIRNRKLYSTQLLGIRKYSLEHVMPKKWQNQWDSLKDLSSIENRNRKLLTLGNLTMISQSLNSTIRDANWHIKRDGKGEKGGLKKYAEGIETLSDYLDLEDWNEDVIRDRAEYLSDLALKIWKRD